MQIRRGKATGVVLVLMEEKILVVGEEVWRTLTQDRDEIGVRGDKSK